MEKEKYSVKRGTEKEEEIREFEKTLPLGYKVCRKCGNLVKINKFLLGSLHICDHE